MANKQISPQRIMQFAWGYGPTLCIEAAVRHGAFDFLDKGPKSIAQIAKATGASVRGLTAVLNVLVSLDLLKKRGDRYALGPESSAFLVSYKPAYHGSLFQHISDQLLPRWLDLTKVVRFGRPAGKVNAKGEGEKFFAQFVESLFPLSFPAASKLGEHLGIGRTKAPVSVLDIGAGSGVWGIALAKQSPHVRIHAVDWPKVLKVTKKIAQRHGLANRMATSAGDFLEADFGKSHQVATVGHIFHSEGRDRSRKLLRKIFRSLSPGGVVAIAEFVPNESRTGPPGPLIFAVNMLVNTAAGDTFTFAEMSAWLREAGFVNPRLLDVPSVSPLVLADKPAPRTKRKASARRR